VEEGREGGRKGKDVPIIPMLDPRMPLTQITAIVILQQVLIQSPRIIKPLLLAKLTRRMPEEAPACIALISMPGQLPPTIQSLFTQKSLLVLHADVTQEPLVGLL
jgi:hypothetical protein